MSKAKKIVKKVAGFAGPIAALTGVGLPLSVAIGAGGGLLSGGGLKGALSGGLGAAALAGGGGLLGGALGLSGATGSAVGGGLLGAASGGLSGGGLKGALLGGALGGLGGYYSAGGFNGLGDSLGLTGSGSLLGESGTSLSQGFGPNAATRIVGGSGILGAGNAAASDIGSALGFNAGGGASSFGDSDQLFQGFGSDAASIPSSQASGQDWFSSLGDKVGLGNSAYTPESLVPASQIGQVQTGNFLSQGFGDDAAIRFAPDTVNNNTGGNMAGSGLKSGIGNILSGITGTNANNEAEKALLRGQSNALSAITPYLNQTYTPGDLTSNPAYQFRLQQGQQALDRTQAARGNLFSGAALKAAQDYGQGLAESEYGADYTRWLQGQAQGLNAATGAANIYSNMGSAQANAEIGRNNILNQSISGLFGNQLAGGGINPQLLQLLRNQSVFG